MKFYSFQIIIEKEFDDSGYLATALPLKAASATANTIEEAKRNIREAIEPHPESMLAHCQIIAQHEPYCESIS
ncbi:MAG: type II toxin-antitoxin system HicB family antitoxin [Deltaproteobacteria bacterium]|nr:type II toxin-antitoxin system HicB family antitoxin [Deltaproteobacteria bacterium]